MVKNWNRRTSESFRFTAKFPKIITHEKRFKNVEQYLELFYRRMEPLKEKILALLIQLPPSYKLKEGLEDFSSHDFFMIFSLKDILDMKWKLDIHHGSMTWHTTFLKIIILQWSGVKWIDYKVLQ